MNYTLHLGDCLEYMTKIDRPFAIVTDPPYGISYSSGGGSEVWKDGSIQNDEDTAVRDAIIKESNGATALVFGSWKRPHPKGTRMKLVWDTKGALGMGDLRLPWKPSHQEIYVLGDPYGFTGRRDTDVLVCAPVQSMAKNGRVHPMEKPVDLMVMLLLKIKPELAILDPFMGSGSTGIAAMILGREFIGCEIESKYYQIAENRIARAALQPGLFTASNLGSTGTATPQGKQPELFTNSLGSDGANPNAVP